MNAIPQEAACQGRGVPGVTPLAGGGGLRRRGGTPRAVGTPLCSLAPGPSVGQRVR